MVEPREHVVPHGNGVARKNLNVLRPNELAGAFPCAPDHRHQRAGRFEEEDRLLTAGVDQDVPV